MMKKASGIKGCIKKESQNETLKQFNQTQNQFGLQVMNCVLQSNRCMAKTHIKTITNGTTYTQNISANFQYYIDPFPKI